ncbi:hypothetical protein GQ457_17G026920 [Hibiscus cannabinus]
MGVLAKDPSVMSSLYSLTMDGTAQAIKKAGSLIKRKKSQGITRMIVPGSPAAMKFSDQTPSEKAGFWTQSCLIEAGAIPPLLNLLYSFNKSMQENAAAALLKLSKHASGKKVMVESGGLRSILAVEINRKMDEAIPGLVDLIREGTPCGRKNAVVALFGLVLYPGNRQRVIGAGTVPLLLDILASPDKHELITDSVALLATLAESFEATFTILRASSLPLITRILQYSTSQAAKEHCVSILVFCCNNGGDEAMGVLAKDPSVMSSLYSLTMDGTAQAIKKAGSLIKSLHKFHETRTWGQGCQAFTQEQSVHVW